MKERDEQISATMTALAIMVGIVIIMSLCTGCRSKQTTVAVEWRDSITERVVHSVRIDTVDVPIPRQSAEVTTRADSSTLLTDVAESRVWILPDGSLRHTLRNLPATLKAPVAVTSDSVVSRGNYRHTECVEVERKLTLWERIKSGTWWWLMLVVLILALIAKNKK